MSSTLAPYGLRPIGAWGGRQYAGSTREIKIATTYSSDLFTGQAVEVHTDGTCIKSDLTGVVGVFVGCAFTQTTGTKYFTTQQYWPASTAATDALAYVVDDPFALFQIQADGSVAQASLGENVDVSITSGYTVYAGSATTGNSTMAALVTTATTNTFPWRLVDFINNPGEKSAVGDTYTELVVAWRFGAHSYLVALGV
jgi:hypothetical protein